MNKEKLEALIKELNINLQKEQLEKFERYYYEMMEWNKKVNLTSITEEKDVLTKHFYDSLLIMLLEEWKSEGKILDLGTGAGLPGIPLCIINKNLNMTLLDSLNKRIVFLKHIIEVLGLNNITALHSRAEELGQDIGYRENFDFVVSRAVARLPVLLEYCLPFVKLNSYFVAYKGPDAEEEIRESSRALDILGGKVVRTVQHELPDNGGKRCIVLIKKIKTTPKEFPRKPGTPEKKAL